jgi:hypothetical protein
MAVSIAHKPKTETVVDEEFVIPEPTSEVVVLPSPPSETPIFDQLLKDFFKDRKDTFQDLLGRRMDPEPVRQFVDRDPNLMTQEQVMKSLGFEDDRPENEIVVQVPHPLSPFITTTRIDASQPLDETQPIPKPVVKPLFDLNEDDKAAQAIMGPMFKLIPDIEE